MCTLNIIYIRCVCDEAYNIRNRSPTRRAVIYYNTSTHNKYYNIYIMYYKGDTGRLTRLLLLTNVSMR